MYKDFKSVSKPTPTLKHLTPKYKRIKETEQGLTELQTSKLIMNLDEKNPIWYGFQENKQASKQTKKQKMTTICILCMMCIKCV